PVARAEQVARVWLAVQQLLGAAAFEDPLFQASQRLLEQPAVVIGERRGEIPAGHQLLSVLDTFGEMWCRGIEGAHAGMQSRTCSGVLRWCDVPGRHGLVIGPQRDHEAVALVNAWPYTRLQGSHRAPDLSEPLRKIDFELRHLLRRGCHPGKHVTGQQAKSE